MNAVHGRDLDLNLLRAFVVVAETGSVTEAARRLYLTQSAVSAALRRLREAIGAPLLARQGRGVVLTARGTRLLADVRPHLAAIVDAALSPEAFSPATSDRTLRLGLADGAEPWLLSRLLRQLATEAPRMRLVVIPVQFRNVADAIASRGVDLAVTVADELPRTVRRQPLFAGRFVCLYDGRGARLRLPLRERDYFAREHVIVSYNGDLRGIVEDLLGRARKVRCSVPSFASVGTAIDGTDLLATVPEIVAHEVRATRPHLRAAPLPFAIPRTPLELLWPVAADDDPASRFLRESIAAIADAQYRALRQPPRPGNARPSSLSRSPGHRLLPSGRASKAAS
jgi:LysR family transcriptional regulator, mexEF-oprN operon transcriptional activator